MWRLILATCLVVGLAGPAKADVAFEASGNRLKQMCAGATDMSTDATYSQGLCMGYITGVEDGLTFADVSCVPAGVTSGQLVEIVAKYLQDHPENLHLHRATLTLAAIYTAFPCPGKK